jgi:hypothetical protein
MSNKKKQLFSFLFIEQIVNPGCDCKRHTFTFLCLTGVVKISMSTKTRQSAPCIVWGQIMCNFQKKKTHCKCSYIFLQMNREPKIALRNFYSLQKPLQLWCMFVYAWPSVRGPRQRSRSKALQAAYCKPDTFFPTPSNN